MALKHAPRERTIADYVFTSFRDGGLIPSCTRPLLAYTNARSAKPALQRAAAALYAHRSVWLYCAPARLYCANTAAINVAGPRRDHHRQVGKGERTIFYPIIFKFPPRFLSPFSGFHVRSRRNLCPNYF